MNVCSVGSMGQGLSDSYKQFNILYPFPHLVGIIFSINGLVPIAAAR